MYRFVFFSLPHIVVQVLQALLAISFNISNNCFIEREVKELTLLVGKKENFPCGVVYPRGPTHPHTLFISSWAESGYSKLINWPIRAANGALEC